MIALCLIMPQKAPQHFQEVQVVGPTCVGKNGADVVFLSMIVEPRCWKSSDPKITLEKE
jgi:hypothetical protein